MGPQLGAGSMEPAVPIANVERTTLSPDAESSQCRESESVSTDVYGLAESRARTSRDLNDFDEEEEEGDGVCVCDAHFNTQIAGFPLHSHSYTESSNRQLRHAGNAARRM